MWKDIHTLYRIQNSSTFWTEMGRKRDPTVQVKTGKGKKAKRLQDPVTPKKLLGKYVRCSMQFGYHILFGYCTCFPNCSVFSYTSTGFVVIFFVYNNLMYVCVCACDLYPIKWVLININLCKITKRLNVLDCIRVGALHC